MITSGNCLKTVKLAARLLRFQRFRLKIFLNYSYVERDAVNMGRIAMNMLLDRIKNPKGSMLTRREYIIPANLVLKGSEYRKL